MAIIDIEMTDEKLIESLMNILQFYMDDPRDAEITVFKEDHPEEERIFEVYKVTKGNRSFVLKKSATLEADIYEKDLNGTKFAIPEYYGSYKDADDTWILMEYIEGADLRYLNQTNSELCATRLSEITNCWWEEDPSHIQPHSRMEKYYERILKRRLCLANLPELDKAYAIFLDRQLTCPRTMSHGDLLPYNIIDRDVDVTFIDWGFSGIMPYALDPARFVAHGAEEKSVFWSTKALRQNFLKVYYSKLDKTNLTYEEYLWDVQLAFLNEYIEFIEEALNDDQDDYEDDDFFHRYLNNATEIAEAINEKRLII